MRAAVHDRAGWEIDSASYRYPDGKEALRGVTLELPAAQLTTIVGPNGAGKSTLLALLLGHLTPTTGRVAYAGRRVTEWPRRDLARRVGVVPQQERGAFTLTVRELVAMGRYPHLGLFGAESDDDRRAVDEALVQCDLTALRDRSMNALSGGEQQRARLARAIAQEPDAIVLDEPTAGLDIGHEMALFEHARALCDAGATVVLVTHHVNLAARYSHRMALLGGGTVVAVGAPADVVQAERFTDLFAWPTAVHPHPGPGADTGTPQTIPIASSGMPSKGMPSR
jgi:iron complex transport system ATP-binding protein